MKRLLKKLALVVPILLGTQFAWGQEEAVERAAALGAIDLPSFFVSIVGGVLLAIGFQLVLSLVSVASGITAVGDVEKRMNRPSRSDAGHDSSEDRTPLGVKITTGLGIWTMITASISLFFASWIAVKLSLIDANFIGVSLGLIIWATFFTLMVYMESRMVSSILGGLISTATSALRSGFSSVSGAFSKSRESEMKEVAAYTVDHARREIAHLMDQGKVEKKINKWVKRMQPDYRQFRKELASLINDIEVREEDTLGAQGVTKEMFLKVAGTVPSLSQQEKEKLGSMFDEIKSVARSGGSRSDKALQAVDKLTPGSEQSTHDFRKQVETYLREANRDEIQPDRLKRDLEEILSHPSRATEVISNRLNQIDRNTLVAVLEQRPDISHDDALRYAGYAEQALNTLRSQFSSTQSKMNELNRPMSGMQSSTDYSSLENAYSTIKTTPEGNQVVSRAPAVNDELPKGAEDRLRQFVSRIPGSEWDYDRIKSDFVRMYHDPTSAPDVLKNRLSTFDRDSVINLAVSSGIEREKAERIANSAVDARDEVIRKAHELENQARVKVEQAKAFATHQAENTRRTAMAASWWLVGTAVASALASVLGGIAAL